MKTTLAVMSREQTEILHRAATSGTPLNIAGVDYLVVGMQVAASLGFSPDEDGRPLGQAQLMPLSTQSWFRPSSKAQLRALPNDNPSIAAFRYEAAVEKPMSLRDDMPHIFFYDGYWRVSLCNRIKDRDAWYAAHGHARKLNGLRPASI